MNKRIISLALAVLMLAAAVPLATTPALAAAPTTPSFEVKHEMTVWDGTTLLFSEEPSQVLREDQYWQGLAYILPAGTKIAQRMDGELVQIYAAGETGIKTGKGVTYSGDNTSSLFYELELTESMTRDQNGVRICGSDMGRGLLTVIVESKTTHEAPSFEVRYEYTASDGTTLLFSEKPLEYIKDEIYYGGFAYEFPVGTKIAHLKEDKLSPIRVASEESAKTEAPAFVDYYVTRQQELYEVVLTTSMSRDPIGIRICSTFRGLLCVVVNGDGYDTVPDSVNPDVQTAPNLDLASEWAQSAIQSAVNKGFIPEDLQDEYTNVITRQEFCRMAVKWVEYMTGISIDSVLTNMGLSRDPNAFTDTNDPDILAAYALGITNGTGLNTFTPNGEFSREQAATMLMNTWLLFVNVNSKAEIVSNCPDAGYADMDSISGWAVNGVNLCSYYEFMSGTGGNMFTPKGTFTRQESIVVFDRLNLDMLR